MFNLGRLTADLLNTLDSAAKDSLEEPQISATSLRKAKKQLQGGEVNINTNMNINIEQLNFSKCLIIY